MPAKVVTKRTSVSVYANPSGTDAVQSTGSTGHYFVTLEFGSGDRKEFTVPGTENGLLADDDTGELTYQGTRYKGFQRTHAGI